MFPVYPSETAARIRLLVALEWLFQCLLSDLWRRSLFDDAVMLIVLLRDVSNNVVGDAPAGSCASLGELGRTLD